MNGSADMAYTRAIVQHGFGGPDVLRYESVALPAPGPGEVCVRQSAIGVNFHDIYVRKGINRALIPPGVPGIEAVGIISAVGAGVSQWRVGDRVGAISGGALGYGGYAAERVIDADLLFALPDGVDDDIAACSLLRGLTAGVLLTQVKRVEAGQSLLAHAASGSTGRLLCQWARHLGARVIGTVSRAPRMEHAVACDAVVVNGAPDWVDQVRALLPQGADYVCDSVGAPTFAGSLEVAAPRGHVALYGQAGGAVDSVPVAALAAKSLAVSRPIVFDWCRSDIARDLVAEFFRLIGEGVLAIDPPHVLPLEQAGQAQSRLEQGGDGAIVLRPNE